MASRKGRCRSLYAAISRNPIRMFETLEERRLLAYTGPLSAPESAPAVESGALQQPSSTETLSDEVIALLLNLPTEKDERNDEVPEEYQGKIVFDDWRALADVQENVSDPSRPVVLNKNQEISLDLEVTTVDDANLASPIDIGATITGTVVRTGRPHVVGIWIAPHQATAVAALDFVVSMRPSWPGVLKVDAVAGQAGNEGTVLDAETERKILGQFNIDPETDPERAAAFLAFLGRQKVDRADEVPAEFGGKISFEDWQALSEVQNSPNAAANVGRVALDSTGRISIDIDVAKPGGANLATLEDFGATVTGVSGSRVGVWIDPDRVVDLAALDFVNVVKTPWPGVRRTGAVNSAGDGILLADQVRALGYNGAGVRIGVISDGVDHRTNVAATGDLPGAITINPSQPGSGDEGTAMLEIIHDLAPGAQLYFSSALTATSMVGAIDWMVNQGVDVIVDDLGFLNEPFFDDGIVADAAQAAIDSGVVYVSAAGNDAMRHYQGQHDDFYGFHDFQLGSGLDVLQAVTVPAGETLTVVLQWSDPFGQSSNDYDLHLYDGLMDVAHSTATQNGNDDPFEALAYTNTGTSAIVLDIYNSAL